MYATLVQHHRVGHFGIMQELQLFLGSQNFQHHLVASNEAEEKVLFRDHLKDKSIIK